MSSGLGGEVEDIARRTILGDSCDKIGESDFKGNTFFRIWFKLNDINSMFSGIFICSHKC